MSRKILVADDEKSIVDIVAFNLYREGYEVVVARDGEKCLEAFDKEQPELVLLDVMMPKMDGFEVCKKIRERSGVPIIMLTARADEVDRVLGLELGADDYVIKPFGVRELLARVKANLRRQDEPRSIGPILKLGQISIDTGHREVTKNGNKIDLTNKEYELIRFLAANHSHVFTREELLEKVWGYDYFGDARTVDVTVRRLRAKVETSPESPQYILTKRGVGYYFSTN